MMADVVYESDVSTVLCGYCCCQWPVVLTIVFWCIMYLVFNSVCRRGRGTNYTVWYCCIVEGRYYSYWNCGNEGCVCSEEMMVFCLGKADTDDIDYWYDPVYSDSIVINHCEIMMIIVIGMPDDEIYCIENMWPYWKQQWRACYCCVFDLVTVLFWRHYSIENDLLKANTKLISSIESNVMT